MKKFLGPKFCFWIFGVILTPTIIALLTTIDIFLISIPLGLFEIIVFSWIVFSLYLTFKSINKVSTKIIVSTIQLIYQSVIILVVFEVYGFSVMFNDFVSPKFIKNELDLEKNFIKRIKNKYDININQYDIIKHISYDSIGEEFRYNMIISTNDYKKEDYLPKNIPTKNTFYQSTLTWNTEHLCLEEKLEIEDKGVRNIICDLRNNPKSLEVSIFKVRMDWEVTTTFFPEHNLIWISETEW